MDTIITLKSETYTRDEAYTKSEDDTLLLLKADKTQLIDSCSKCVTYARNEVFIKTETKNLLNKKADAGVSYCKNEDDALLVLQADKTQLIDSYTKGEAVNMLNNKTNQSTTYNKSETDQLISQIEVSDVDLSGYMTLGTAQTINANKSFNNSCRFVSSTDGMSTVTGSSFVKSGANDTAVLLEVGGTKPISEFTEVDAKLTNAITTNTTLSITGTKTFKANISATNFGNAGKDDTSVLLEGGGDRLLSSFGRIEDLSSSAFSNMNGAVEQCKLIRIGNLYIFSLLAYGRNYNARTFNPDYLVIDDMAVATYIPFPNRTIDKDGNVMITHSTGLITLKSNTNTYIQYASATWVK
ncbi:MAG: hypothetical protein EZS28_032701 [Streblomastix strix]|uniref:Uncharacterized protein n=1 Tax=Streblomastix strix TaxID=222440 RepID=A0A5J4UNW9_9EUKA|nr:MAG: hypothetical protein EZS28_032701 [Streblomastix strix]